MEIGTEIFAHLIKGIPGARISNTRFRAAPQPVEAVEGLVYNFLVVDEGDTEGHPTAGIWAEVERPLRNIISNRSIMIALQYTLYRDLEKMLTGNLPVEEIGKQGINAEFDWSTPRSNLTLVRILPSIYPVQPIP